MKALLLLALLAATPAAAHDHWDAHAAAGLLDTTWPTMDACTAALAEARAAEAHPARDIDPRLKGMFQRAACTAITDTAGESYALRLHWPSLDPQPTPALADATTPVTP